MSYYGAAASIVGNELQGWAAMLARDEMFNQFKREAALQQGYRGQGQDIFGGALGQSSLGQAEKDLSKGASDRMASYRATEDVPLGFNAPGQKGYSTDVGYGRLLGGNRARLGAYSDFALQQALRSNQSQRLLDQLTSFAGGQARNVFPYQMYKAQHSQDDLAAIGQAISSLGGGSANFAQTFSGPQTNPYMQGQPYQMGSTGFGYQEPLDQYGYPLFGGTPVYNSTGYNF